MNESETVPFHIINNINENFSIFRIISQNSQSLLHLLHFIFDLRFFFIPDIRLDLWCTSSDG